MPADHRSYDAGTRASKAIPRREDSGGWYAAVSSATDGPPGYIPSPGCCVSGLTADPKSASRSVGDSSMAPSSTASTATIKLDGFRSLCVTLRAWQAASPSNMSRSKCLSTVWPAGSLRSLSQKTEGRTSTSPSSGLAVYSSAWSETPSSRKTSHKSPLSSSNASRKRATRGSPRRSVPKNRSRKPESTPAPANIRLSTSWRPLASSARTARHTSPCDPRCIRRRRR
mmetsp:Transcript_22707/g.49625  ORF Transcript_22707/g.49625 Transcript_22707/m.49625 type:complete len:227 (-) Transcript_22707:774-1454(-)